MRTPYHASVPVSASFVKTGICQNTLRNALFDEEPRVEYSFCVEYDLAAEHQKILSFIMRFVAVVGALAYVPGTVVGAVERLWAVVAVNTIAYATVAAIAFIPGVGYRAKLTVLVGACLAVGSVVLASTGPLGAGYIWLLVGVVLSALFGRKRAVALTIGATTAIMIGWAVALALGADGRGAAPWNVAIIGASLLVICLALSMVIRRLQDSLAEAFEEHSRLADSLAAELQESRNTKDRLEATLAEEDRLLRELQHRVRNNLQTVASLLSLDERPSAGRDSVADGPLDGARRRLRALTVANDCFLDGPDGGRAEAWGLIRSAAQSVDDGRREVDCRLACEDGDCATIDPHAAPLIAILVSDVVAGLAQLGRVSLTVEPGDRAVAEIRRRDPGDCPEARSVYRGIASGRVARSAEPEVRLSFIEPDGDLGPGIRLEYREGRVST